MSKAKPVSKPRNCTVCKEPFGAGEGHCDSPGCPWCRSCTRLHGVRHV